MNPNSLDVDAAARLREVSLRLARRIRKHARPGLTPSQHSMLATVARHGPLRIGEVARREQLEKSSVTRGMAHLEALGCVTRVTDPADGRGSLLALTAHGAALLEAADARANDYLAAALGALDEDERAAVLLALPAIERMVRRSS